MSNLIDNIFLWTKNKISKKILKFYNQNNYCIVNFIYFANLHKFIIDKKDKKYSQALENWNFLLPDGIALKIYLKNKYKKTLKENLNWTDFTPYFINFLKKNNNINLAIYTVYDEKIWKTKNDVKKVEKYIKDNFKINNITSFVSHYKNRWKDFNFLEYKKTLQNNKINLFLVWIGSPFQEIWTIENKDFFKENNILVINVWWLFDFWSNFEKRAPKLFLKLNLEWLRRFRQNPKKNYKKVIESFKLFKEILKK